MNRNIIVPIVAIVVLGGLEAVALMNGIDGVLFTSIAAIIGGLGGYGVHKARSKNEGK